MWSHDRAIADTVAAIEGVLGRAAAASAPAAATQFDVVRARPVMDELASLLVGAEGGAVTYFSEHRAQLRSALGAQFTAALERAVNDFDFEGALALLRPPASSKATLPERK